MKRIFIITVISSLFLANCNSETTLQKYFVENSENKNFISVDLAPSILNTDKTKLTVKQNEALKSFDKMNIIAFKLDDKNQAVYEVEKAKVKTIIKDKKYQELMRFGSGKEGASISFVGTQDNIKEFVLFGNKKDAGFAIVRVLGKDMNPDNILELISVLKNSDIDFDQLKPFQELIKK